MADQPDVSTHLPSRLAERHPRRRPARDSVSLKHNPTTAAAAPRADSHAPTAASLASHNYSPANTNNSQAWIDDNNNHPALCKTTPIDHEPPFFLPDSSSGTPGGNISRGAPSLPPSVPFPPVGPWRREGLEGQLDDYRSVIDDLTIQNKKLLKRLRRHERASHDHLSSERLFEVKFHGLSSRKKRELEDLLKGFALTLNHTPAGNALNQTNVNHVPATDSMKPSASLTSNQFGDSGYGSMSASFNPSLHRYSSNASNVNSTGLEASKARDRNIRSYLHDIPEGLLPQPNSTFMSDDDKKRHVVARLEQLFQGSGAALNGHSQPIQQQEVSQLAASADRKEQEALGQRLTTEGSREARIMEDGMEPSTANQQDPDSGYRAGPGSAATLDGQMTTPSEQRPTRPLDLDPHRAQDPSENVGYIRHLGFAVSDPSPAPVGPESQGWIYLNLLINMAQLHTLNVSTSLVKEALRTYSSKFELSDDGRKIRWHPNAPRAFQAKLDLVQNSSGDAPSRPRHDGRSQNIARGVKRTLGQFLDHSSTSNSSAIRHSNKQSVSGESSSKMSLTPLPARPDYTSMDNEGDGWGHAEDENEGLLPTVAEYSNDSPRHSLDDSATQRSQSSLDHDRGALVFFQNSQFFLDFSGDHANSNDMTSKQRHYHVSNTQPLGYQPPQLTPKSSDGSSVHAPPPPSFSGSLEVNTDPSEASEKIQVDDSLDLQAEASSDTPEPLHFESSGVGYVYPSDNFVLYVKRDVGPAIRFRDLQTTLTKPTKAASPASPPLKKARVISVSHRRLKPSDLPPATFAISPDDDAHDASDSDENNAEDDMDIDIDDSSDDVESEPSQSCDPEEDGQFDGEPSSPEKSTTRFSSDAQSRPVSLPQGTVQSSSFDDQENQSVDFLATAREIDPTAIRAREREYDAELAERLAEEIPAGSSAATRGGGSGFNTPARLRHAVAERAAQSQAMHAKREGSDDIDSTFQERSVSS